MDIIIRNYKISPYSGNTCWKIQEKASEGSKYSWKEPYYYPSTLIQSLIKVRELILMDEDASKEASSLDQAISSIEELNTEFDEILEKFSN